jgi:small-conductance mechanosensitive channel
MMNQWILPIAFIVGGTLLGTIVEKTVLKQLTRNAFRQRSLGRELVYKSLDQILFLWFFLAGLLGAIATAPYIDPKIIDPGIRTTIRNGIFVLWAFSVIVILARLSGTYISIFLQRRAGTSVSLFSTIIKTAVIVLGSLTILQAVGVNVTPVIAALGIGGLAVSLAVKDTLENLMAGLSLLISKQVKTGDYIRLDSTYEGYVVDINWRNTTIRQLSNNIIFIPNSKLASSIFTNFHLPAKEISLSVGAAVGYGSDLEKVEQITLEVAKETMREVSPDFVTKEPKVRFQDFGDFCINFTVSMHVPEFVDQFTAKHLFIKKLNQRYTQDGIRVPFPTRELYVLDKQAGNGEVPSSHHAN